MKCKPGRTRVPVVQVMSTRNRAMGPPRHAPVLALALLPFAAPGHAIAAAREPMVVSVDATDAARKLFHAEVSIPARPGPLTLAYPRWLYHARTGTSSAAMVRTR